MASIELYINKQLCEIENPDTFSIYLKRQFLNPAELSTKDAQKSYDITLPATAVNNAIFGYTNTEEVRGKFSQLYDAQLLVGGVKIFDGKFRLSSITKKSYKGNLGVPAPKTVKDIFGETMMNQAGKWMVDFKDESDAEKYNTGAYDKDKYGDIAPCIFPFVLYGLLPRYNENGDYPEKTEYDDSVLLNMNDVPPSMNCVQMLKQVFKNAGYELSGSAMDDERIKNLYVSYRNENDYEMPWSVGEMKVSAKWNNYLSGWIESRRYTRITSPEELNTVSTNIFNSVNINDIEIVDTGNNIKRERKRSPLGFRLYENITFSVPRSGLYKVEFNAKIRLGNDASLQKDRDVNLLAGSFGKKYELKVVRNYDEDAFSNERFDNTFYKDNQDQDSTTLTSFFPQKGQPNFIDPKQNANFICGFSWGYDSADYLSDFYSPLNTEGIRANPMAISGGNSWDGDTKVRLYSAVNSAGYVYADGSPIDRYKVELNGAPETKTEQLSESEATGNIAQVIWLEKGDTLSVVDTSNLTYAEIVILFKKIGFYCWHNHEIDFELSLTPFQQSKSWLTIQNNGASLKDNPMNWNDKPTLLQDQINLIRFLPAGVKINDWVDNFCKAFNLKLIGTENGFDLNLSKNDLVTSTSAIIDLDKHASVEQSTNESLKLPYMYELGFTVNNNEEGYYDTITEYVKDENGDKTDEKMLNAGENGGGKYYTSSNETSVVTHTSSFSYNWFKQLKDLTNNQPIALPVITEREIWSTDESYKDMVGKTYFNLSQRFWYPAGTFTVPLNKTKGIKLALVSNEYDGVKKVRLDYKDKPDSIACNFFLLLTDGENNYTVVNCYLSPEEYARIDQALVKFNGDLYYIAEIDGYEPSGRKKATLKLIRKTR